MRRRHVRRLFILAVAALLIWGALKGHAVQPSYYCGSCGHGSYSTPGPTEHAHPLRNLRRALTRGSRP